MVRATEARSPLAKKALIAALSFSITALVTAEHGGLRRDNDKIFDAQKETSPEKTKPVLDNEFLQIQRHLVHNEDHLGPVPIDGMLGSNVGDSEITYEIGDEAFLDPSDADRLLGETRDTNVNDYDATDVHAERALRGGKFDRTSAGHRGIIRGDDDEQDGAGTDETSAQKFIVNGKQTSGKYKAMCVTMRKSGDNYFKGYCGCQAISPNYVILAAHCHSNTHENDLGAQLNAFYFNPVRMYERDVNGKPNAGHPFQVVDRAWCKRHPNHIPGGAAPHDVMVCKTVKPIHPTIQAAIPHIADESYVEAIGAGSSVWAMGMGQTSFGGPKSNTNLEIALPYVPWSTCRNKLSGWNFDSSMICAGGDGRGDACGGDSGGPLSVRESSGRHVQIGVTSWGYQCNVAGYPGVWSNLGGQLSWIKSVCQGDRLKIASAGSGRSGGARVNYSIGSTSNRAQASVATFKAQRVGNCNDSDGTFQYWNGKSSKHTTCEKVALKTAQGNCQLCEMHLNWRSDSEQIKEGACCSACLSC